MTLSPQQNAEYEDILRSIKGKKRELKAAKKRFEGFILKHLGVVFDSDSSDVIDNWILNEYYLAASMLYAGLWDVPWLGSRTPNYTHLTPVWELN